MSSAPFTAGPWRWEFNPGHKIVRLVGGVRRYDLTVMEFRRYGMQRAAPHFRDTAHDGCNIMHRFDRADWVTNDPGREHHADWHRLLTHPDARLIEAAPTLYSALQNLLRTVAALPATAPQMQAAIRFSEVALDRAKEPS